MGTFVEGDDRIGSDLRELRRDLAETHTQVNRSHHALTTLATTLKEVVQRQDRSERRISLNSFIAYVLFTALLGAGFLMLYRGRAAHLAEVRAAADRARVAAIAEADAAKKALAAREEGARVAAGLLALAHENKRGELMARASEMNGKQVSPVEKQVIEEAVTRARAETVDAAFAAGNDAARQQQWEKATTELRVALGFEPDGNRAAAARVTLGMALLKQGKPEEASKELELALAGGAERGAAELRYHLANALELAKQPERARAEFTRFADSKPLHPWAQMARRKAAILTRAARAAATTPQ